MLVLEHIIYYYLHSYNLKKLMRINLLVAELQLHVNVQHVYIQL